ncbi:hypothetical protein [Terriglobus saanensis]|uniref:Two component transcriptional regulator n=1 Tax=Terriglobus saanensis (strain ATCC BAA-1853 / DSM 23119 / SP1PR4) TaxID=401053 RepID=E8UZH9_TERSS|nr:hypothetical protein [Terriglobus saanensis]ADV83259.1 two component transcriptional regulator [Terriglobus saanensis SP1PR4]
MDEKLHREMWTSWASLLRSYAAAHGLNSPQHAVVEVSEERITVRHGLKWISFTSAAYKSSDGSTVPFSLTENGTAVVDGLEDEMDLAAERLAREIIAA